MYRDDSLGGSELQRPSSRSLNPGTKNQFLSNYIREFIHDNRGKDSLDEEVFDTSKCKTVQTSFSDESRKLNVLMSAEQLLGSSALQNNQKQISQYLGDAEGKRHVQRVLQGHGPYAYVVTANDKLLQLESFTKTHRTRGAGLNRLAQRKRNEIIYGSTQDTVGTTVTQKTNKYKNKHLHVNVENQDKDIAVNTPSPIDIPQYQQPMTNMYILSNTATKEEEPAHPHHAQLSANNVCVVDKEDIVEEEEETSTSFFFPPVTFRHLKLHTARKNTRHERKVQEHQQKEIQDTQRPTEVEYGGPITPVVNLAVASDYVDSLSSSLLSLLPQTRVTPQNFHHSAVTLLESVDDMHSANDLIVSTSHRTSHATKTRLVLYHEQFKHLSRETTSPDAMGGIATMNHTRALSLRHDFIRAMQRTQQQWLVEGQAERKLLVADDGGIAGLEPVKISGTNFVFGEKPLLSGPKLAKFQQKQQPIVQQGTDGYLPHFANAAMLAEETARDQHRDIAQCFAVDLLKQQFQKYRIGQDVIGEDGLGEKKIFLAFFLTLHHLIRLEIPLEQLGITPEIEKAVTAEMKDVVLDGKHTFLTQTDELILSNPHSYLYSQADAHLHPRISKECAKVENSANGNGAVLYTLYYCMKAVFTTLCIDSGERYLEDPSKKLFASTSPGQVNTNSTVIHKFKNNFQREIDAGLSDGSILAVFTAQCFSSTGQPVIAHHIQGQRGFLTQDYSFLPSCLTQQLDKTRVFGSLQQPHASVREGIRAADAILKRKSVFLYAKLKQQSFTVHPTIVSAQQTDAQAGIVWVKQSFQTLRQQRMSDQQIVVKLLSGIILSSKQLGPSALFLKIHTGVRLFSSEDFAIEMQMLIQKQLYTLNVVHFHTDVHGHVSTASTNYGSEQAEYVDVVSKLTVFFKQTFTGIRITATSVTQFNAIHEHLQTNTSVFDFGSYNIQEQTHQITQRKVHAGNVPHFDTSFKAVRMKKNTPQQGTCVHTHERGKNTSKPSFEQTKLLAELSKTKK